MAARNVTHFEFVCPICGRGKGRADWKLSRLGGHEWFIGCWTQTCRDLTGSYLRELAEAVRAIGGGAAIKDNPLQWLDPFIVSRHTAGAGTKRAAELLPSVAKIEGWQQRLLRSPEALAYLTDERGLMLATIERYQLGYDGRAITIPVYRRGRLVNLRRRFLGPGAKPKITGLRGRGAQLYPRMPRGRAVVLCAGEFDALVCLQAGLPAVTTTCGSVLPEQLAGALAGRRVAVAFDVGEESSAARAVERLLASGARAAWVVPLDLPNHGDDLTDWFVTYGRTAPELRTLLNEARRGT